MLGDLLGSLVDKEKATYEIIQDSLELASQELKCNPKELFFMIKPVDEESNFKIYIYKLEDGIPKSVREIKLKEILGLDNQ